MEVRAKRRTLKLIVDEKEHMIRFPTLGELSVYREKLNKKDADQTELLIEFLEALGLAREAFMSLEAVDVTEVVNALVGEKKA